jgi:hypothetical protein
MWVLKRRHSDVIYAALRADTITRHNVLSLDREPATEPQAPPRLGRDPVT